MLTFWEFCDAYRGKNLVSVNKREIADTLALVKAGDLDENVVMSQGLAVAVAQACEAMGKDDDAREMWARAYNQYERNMKEAAKMKFDKYMEAAGHIYDSKMRKQADERWYSRIDKFGWQHEGIAGAMKYLKRFGGNIGAPKVIALAQHCEDFGFDDIALGFWAKAFSIEYPEETTDLLVADGIGNVLAVHSWVLLEQDSDGYVEATEVVERHALALAGERVPFSPLVPGQFSAAQPVDATQDRSYYVQLARFWGQPKRMGHKLIIFATEYERWYQTRQRGLNDAPCMEFDIAIRKAAEKLGSFVLEGELYHRDINDGEWQSLPEAAERNKQLGSDEPGQMTFGAFGCVWAGERVITKKADQIEYSDHIMGLLETLEPEMFKKVPTAKTQAEKRALCDHQKEHGLEGEVWFRYDLSYVPGKVTDSGHEWYGAYVRTKYKLEPKPYRVVGVMPSNAEGHTIANFEVVDEEGVNLGKVGTGYTREQQVQIMERFQANPDNFWVLVGADSMTVYGKFKHAVFHGFVEDKTK